jgi:Raf kinase inhibitor-like YbhB/YbcL family protein
MKLTSDAFVDNTRIPDRYCFGNPSSSEHVQLGENRNPGLSWSGIPENAQSLVLLCVDPDVPTSGEDVNQDGKTVPATLARTNFYHWVMINIEAVDGSIKDGYCSAEITSRGKRNPPGPPNSRQGINDYTNWFAADPEMSGQYYGYDGPCPPWNDSLLHHYHFVLYAVDLKQLELSGAFTGADVMAKIEGHIVGEARLIGTYSLNPDVK